MEIVKFRVRELPVSGYPEQTRTQLQVSLQCPHCGQIGEHVLEERSDIWRWGLDQRIEQTARTLLLREDLFIRPHVTVNKVFYCEECGIGSVVTRRSITVFVGELTTLVGHLHEGFGPPWALKALEDQMVRHLSLENQNYPPWGDRFYQDSHSGNRINEFFLRLCPCKLCERAREQDYKRIVLEQRHIDLEYYRSKIPVVTPAEPVTP